MRFVRPCIAHAKYRRNSISCKVLENLRFQGEHFRTSPGCFLSECFTEHNQSTFNLVARTLCQYRQQKRYLCGLLQNQLT